MARGSHDKPGNMTMPNYKIKDMKHKQNAKPKETVIVNSCPIFTKVRAVII